MSEYMRKTDGDSKVSRGTYWRKKKREMVKLVFGVPSLFPLAAPKGEWQRLSQEARFRKHCQGDSQPSC
jgi:hypothetical protein